jgi:hypothetical protein
LKRASNTGLLDEFAFFASNCLPHLRRGILEWMESEVRIPDGPYKGLKFKADRQPFARLWLEEIDKGIWTRYVFIGPPQIGKTFLGVLAPTMHSLFELKETVVAGVPDKNMVNDKWVNDFKPVIVANYAHLMPRIGEGAEGGPVKNSVTFQHGVTLKFMTAGGSDAGLAGFTTRRVVVTEVDKMDEAGATSKETDKVSQIEARNAAYGDLTGQPGDSFLECTLTDEDGRIWREYSEIGTKSRITMPCWNCGEFVTLGRDDLVGWQNARDIVEAKERTQFVCCACKAPWTDEQRAASALRSVLVHDGQSIDRDGVITGEARGTNTLGFRVSAVDNLFRSAGEVGVMEWRAARDPDEENAMRKVYQQIWAMPTKVNKQDVTALTQDHIQKRQTGLERGVCPHYTMAVGVGMDLGKHVAHFAVLAADEYLGGAFVDYDILEVHGRSIGEDAAIRKVIEQAAEKFMEGFTTAQGELLPLGALLVDARNWTIPVCETVMGLRREGVPIMAAMGFGAFGRGGNQMYQRPKVARRNIKFPFLGSSCHEERDGKGSNAQLKLKIDVDSWKTRLLDAYSIAYGERGSVGLFDVKNLMDHKRYSAHLTAEKKVEEFKGGARGTVVWWEKLRDDNHYLDASMLGMVAAHVALEGGVPKVRANAGGGFEGWK